MKNIFLLFLLTLAFLFASNNNIFAQNNYDFQFESINPGDNYTKYFQKRLSEKFNYILSFSKKHRADLLKDYSERRFRELVYTIENDDRANLETATQRYFTSVGKYTEYLNKHDINDKKDEAYEIIQSQIPIIEKIRDYYEYGTAEWRFLEDDKNYANSYATSLR